jgi:hypothetical protein
MWIARSELTPSLTREVMSGPAAAVVLAAVMTPTPAAFTAARFTAMFHDIQQGL